MSHIGIFKPFSELNRNSFEIIKTPNGYIKKYANGHFEAFAQTNIKDRFKFLQMGNSGIYYANFTNFAIGISATEITAIHVNAYNSGLIWAGNLYETSNKDAINGMVFQYGNDATRTTYLDLYVEGRWM